MLISPEQIRAGRALLGWSARELAEHADVSLNTIQRLETKSLLIAKSSVETIDKITRALTDNGVELTDNGRGVRLRG